MKTFYIAGRTKNIAAIKEMASRLTDLGYEWSYNWTDHPPVQELPGDPVVNQLAEDCIAGLKKTDLFILYADSSDGARGMFIEFGLVLASSAKIWIIGDEKPSVFSCLKRVRHAENIDEIIDTVSEDLGKT